MIDVISFLFCLAFVTTLLFGCIEAKMECHELRIEVEVKDAAIEQLEKEKEKLKKENSFLRMEIFHNVSGGYQKYNEKKEKEESDKE